MSNPNASKFESETGGNLADPMKEITGNDKMPIRDLRSEEKAANIFEEGWFIQITGNDRIWSRTVFNTEESVYLLGCFACGGFVNPDDPDMWQIRVRSNRRNILQNLQEFEGIRSVNKLEDQQNGFSALIVFNKMWTIFAEKLGMMMLSPVAFSKFPDLSDSLTKAFIRGYFDVSGDIDTNDIDANTHSCRLKFLPKAFLPVVQEKIGVTGINSESGTLTFSGVNALDFLAKIYEKSSLLCRFPLYYKQFCDLLTFYNTDINRNWTAGSFKCLWKKNDPNALPLRKNRCSDTGFDLALIRKEKQLNSFTDLYDTGISISPPTGYYFDVVPRSSISKTGYILANCTGIIDASYSGSIKVALLKVDDSVPELVLPNYMVQLIPRKYTHMDFQEVAELEQTERSDKGFGSTELQSLRTSG
jgi:dUTP pyrophosphatase